MSGHIPTLFHLMSPGRNSKCAIKRKKAIAKTQFKEDIMKLTSITLLSTVIFLFSFSTSYGDNRAVNGMIIGGGSGALIGQAIGHNSEATIIGAAVGSVVGLIIGSNTHSPVQTYHRPPPTRPYIREYHHHHPRVVKKRHRHHPRPVTLRKETIIVVR